jgi:prepilin-type N-terminal cleavage/methylation domain-containing protein
VPRRSPPSPVLQPGGFTLIELVLVIVLFAIAGAFALPALQPALESVRAEAAARRTASFLDDVRRRSVVGRAVYTVRCLPDDDRLDADGPGDLKLAFALPEGADLVGCRPVKVRYFPQGYASGITLTLRDRSGRERMVTVGTFTGLARVADGS